jgi:hypothetical protein
MDPTFDIIGAVTVPPTYSWDDGIPSVTYTSLLNRLTDTQQLLSSGEYQYVGYAPYFAVLLSSTPFSKEDPSRPVATIQQSFISREINFGDYYNSETNIDGGNATKFVPDEQYFATHTYIMPGTYSITFTQTLFDVVTSSDDNSIFKQEVNNSYQRLPFSWQWYNFLQDSNNSRSNIPATWQSTGFQQQNELVWDKTKGECVALNYIDSNIVWQWNNIVSEFTNTSSLTLKLCGASLTWNNLACDTPRSASWNFTKTFFRGDLININLASTSRTIEKKYIIKVLEIPPQPISWLFYQKTETKK